MDGTAEALRRLVLDEHVQVVALQGFIRLPSGTGNKARERTLLARRYLNETRSLAERLHVTYLDLPQGTLQENDAFFLPDSTHFTAAAHRAIANVILNAFKDGRISVRSERLTQARQVSERDSMLPVDPPLGADAFTPCDELHTGE